jgi:hypothetical protein
MTLSSYQKACIANVCWYPRPCLPTGRLSQMLRSAPEICAIALQDEYLHLGDGQPGRSHLGQNVDTAAVLFALRRLESQHFE